MSSKDLLTDDELNEFQKSASYYPHTTPAGRVDSSAVSANELLKLRGDISRLTKPGLHNVLYDSGQATLIIGLKQTALQPYSKEDLLCQVLFKNTKAMKKIWDRDEVIERWSNTSKVDYKVREVSDAARRINDKVANLLDSPLFITKGKSVSLNQQYV